MSGQAGCDQAFWDLLTSADPPSSLEEFYAVVKGFPGTPLTVETLLVEADDPSPRCRAPATNYTAPASCRRCASPTKPARLSYRCGAQARWESFI